MTIYVQVYLHFSDVSANWVVFSEFNFYYVQAYENIHLRMGWEPFQEWVFILSSL